MCPCPAAKHWGTTERCPSQEFVLYPVPAPVCPRCTSGCCRRHSKSQTPQGLPGCSSTWQPPLRLRMTAQTAGHTPYSPLQRGGRGDRGKGGNWWANTHGPVHWHKRAIFWICRTLRLSHFLLILTVRGFNHFLVLFLSLHCLSMWYSLYYSYLCLYYNGDLNSWLKWWSYLPPAAMELLMRLRAKWRRKLWSQPMCGRQKQQFPVIMDITLSHTWLQRNMI